MEFIFSVNTKSLSEKNRQNNNMLLELRRKQIQAIRELKKKEMMYEKMINEKSVNHNQKSQESNEVKVVTNQKNDSKMNNVANKVIKKNNLNTLISNMANNRRH